jgi:hypothetical protein
MKKAQALTQSVKERLMICLIGPTAPAKGTPQIKTKHEALLAIKFKRTGNI